MNKLKFICSLLLLIGFLCASSCSWNKQVSTQTGNSESGAGQDESESSGSDEIESPESGFKPDSNINVTINKERAPREFINGTHFGCTWDNFVYYSTLADSRIFYQCVNDPYPISQPLLGDPLASDRDDPFYMAWLLFLIDEKSTVENENLPILIIAYRYYADDSFEDERTRICSFDTKTNRMDTLADGFSGYPSQLALYKDKIYFSTFDSEKGEFVVRRINRDGGGELQMGESTPYEITIQYINDDLIYYLDHDDSCVYTCRTDFTGKTKFYDSFMEIFYISDEYMYYGEPKGGEDRRFSTLYRSDKNAPKERESLVDYFGCDFFDDVCYIIVLGKVSTYNIYTGETKTLIENLTPNDEQKSFYAFSDTYIIFDTDRIEDHHGIETITCLDVKTGKEWAIAENR